MKNRQHCFDFRGVVSDYIRTELQAGFKITAGIFKSLFFVYCVAKADSSGLDLTTVCVTDGSETGGIYNEARVTTGLTIYGFLSAAEKTLFFFLPTKPRPESAQKAV